MLGLEPPGSLPRHTRGGVRGPCANRAMSCLPMEVKHELFEILHSSSFLEGPCPCYSYFTGMIHPKGLLAEYSDRMVWDVEMIHFERKTGVNIWGDGLNHMPCSHEPIRSFPLHIRLEDAHILQNHDKIVLYRAKNLLAGAVPCVDVRDLFSGMIPVTCRNSTVASRSVILAEMFCGGFSGWSHVNRTLVEMNIPIRHAWSMDIDSIALQTYVRTHADFDMIQTPMDAKTIRDLSDGNLTLRQFAFQTDVRLGWFLSQLPCSHTDIVLMSPPCPPWSLASKARGLHVADGRTFVYAWGLISVIRPSVVAVEEVASMVQHIHWPQLQKLIEWAGYKIVASESMNLVQILPQNRNRVIMLAVDRFATNLAETFSWTKWPVGPSMTLATAKCILPYDKVRFDEVVPDHETISMYMNPEMLPKNDHEGIKKRTKKDVRSYRIRELHHESVACIMANYGKGHLLPCKSSVNCKQICIPAVSVNEQSPLVITGCLHNLGQKHVAVKKDDHDQVKVDDTTVIAITMYRDELPESEWGNVTNQPVRCALTALGVHDEDALSAPPWGRSWQHNGNKSDPQFATSVQFHARVSVAKLEKYLKLSGRGGTYVTPKMDSNTADCRYAIVWMDQDPVSIAKLLVDIPAHLGPVRIMRGKGDNIKCSRGIRCKHDDFESIFKKLKPTQELPDIRPVSILYKIQPVPLGADQSAVTTWLKQQKIEARPIKALRHSSWLIGSAVEVPLQFLTWNGKAVMLKRIQSKHANRQNAIIAGSLPNKRVSVPSQATSSKNTNEDGIFKNDPWSSYTPTMGPKPSTNSGASVFPRQVEAPIETRFTKQDQQIAKLEHSVSQLQERLDNKDAADREFQQNIQKDITTVKTDVAQQLGLISRQFETSMTKALKKQDDQMTNGFAELKQMLRMSTQPVAVKKAKTQPPPPPGSGGNGDNVILGDEDADM